jgi:CRISPR/Cas system Type II protein with McrA/HNH and RuvC-like nuclease domain
MEAEARWRLVETAWELNIGRNLLQIKSDSEFNLYVESSNRRRKSITSSRHALNGYQKGKCFYCFHDITLDAAAATFADVDHFFAWSLGHDKAIAMKTNLDGVWNLVLACVDCNRGPAGKFARVPEPRFVARLQRRNNFLISSHHPLRETLIAQMGATEAERASFLEERHREARERLIHQWSPPVSSEEAAAF